MVKHANQVKISHSLPPIHPWWSWCPWKRCLETFCYGGQCDWDAPEGNREDVSLNTMTSHSTMDTVSCVSYNIEYRDDVKMRCSKKMSLLCFSLSPMRARTHTHTNRCTHAQKCMCTHTNSFMHSKHILILFQGHLTDADNPSLSTCIKSRVLHDYRNTPRILTEH